MPARDIHHGGRMLPDLFAGLGEGRRGSAVNELPTGILVIGVDLEHRPELGAGFILHSEHHVRHPQIVAGVHMAGISGYNALERRDGTIKVAFEALNEPELPSGVGVGRINR